MEGNWETGFKDRFNKSYRITDNKDTWGETKTRNAFEDWKRLIERFVGSGPPECTTLLEYALTKQDPINLRGTIKDIMTGNTRLVHQEIIDKVPKAVEYETYKHHTKKFFF